MVQKVVQDVVSSRRIRSLVETVVVRVVLVGHTQVVEDVACVWRTRRGILIQVEWISEVALCKDKVSVQVYRCGESVGVVDHKVR